MSEKSDLRERAREWTTACRTIDLNEHEKEGVGIMLELLQALDDAEREERERCAVTAERLGCDQWECGDTIAAAIRREGGKGWEK